MIRFSLLSVYMCPYVEILYAYFADVLDVKEYFQFELIFEIFILYKDRIVLIIDFDIPRQKD